MFRDGRRAVTGSGLRTSLTSALRGWRTASETTFEDCALRALIAAGELECTLLDADDGTPRSDSRSVSPENNSSKIIASEITDATAAAFLAGYKQSHGQSLELALQKARQIAVAARYEVSVQEGFAYYALHPRKVALLVDQLAEEWVDPLAAKRRVAVLGIRSIGLTLSAVACAALRLRGVQCERISVRPTGHPYDRSLAMTPELQRWIERWRDAEFLIVDEGPGISGSSFLAVAEALGECGIEGERIHLVGSRAVDPATLRAANAAGRWAKYRFHVMQSAPLAPAEAGESLSGGTWRRYFRCEEGPVAAVWPALESAKFLSRDQRSLFKFEGFGGYGEAIGTKAKLLADRGFSPRYLGNSRGFGRYELAPGHVLNRRDRSDELLERMADYLALRATRFLSDAAQTPELETMLRWNWQLEFGEELNRDESRLQVKRAVVCDGRMMPDKWLRTDAGELLKLDSGSHGDNHFFPGPCDIAWDVAGAIVEWEMRGDVRERFVRGYEARAGDSISSRLAPYLLAYATFSLGWARMAALAVQGEYDEALLERDYKRYRAIAQGLRQEQGALEIPEKGAGANVGSSRRSA